MLVLEATDQLQGVRDTDHEWTGELGHLPAFDCDSGDDGRVTPLPSIDTVTGHIRDVAERIITPRWRSLNDGDIAEKAPGDLVTVADTEAEAELTATLAGLTPGALIVGEEAVAADPSLVAGLPDADVAWTIDPIDGTSNFVAGSEHYGTMVAAIRRGETVMAWILLPTRGVILVAERGSGATRNGLELDVADRRSVVGEVTAVLKTKYLAADLRDHVVAQAPLLGSWSAGTGCAASDYDDLVAGETDTIFWGQTHPWDHAPGCLILTEAGGMAGRWDRSRYRPGTPGFGLTVARGPRTWDLIHHTLGPPG